MNAIIKAVPKPALPPPPQALLPASNDNILSLIGNTPLVRLQRIAPNPNVVIYGKMESHNPGGSVKDRPALSMILGAEKKKLLQPYTKLIEPTSGNTGIGLAMVASIRGYDLELVMPENASRERWRMMEAFGAKITLTPATHEMEGAIDYTHEKLARSKGAYVMLDQFSNPDNCIAHYKTTAPELWYGTEQKLTHFVSAMGTTGTIIGVSRYMREYQLPVKVIGARPSEGSSIPGIRRWPTKYLPKIFDESLVDETVEVSSAQAIVMTRRLAQEEGIFCGTSSGGAAHIAIELAKRLKSGVIAFVVCDRGERYLSTDLFSSQLS